MPSKITSVNTSPQFKAMASKAILSIIVFIVTFINVAPPKDYFTLCINFKFATFYKPTLLARDPSY